jgi:hypothetical protein
MIVINVYIVGKLMGMPQQQGTNNVCRPQRKFDRMLRTCKSRAVVQWKS